METQASASPAAAEPLPPSELSADHQQADDVAERVPDASSSPAPPSRPLEASAQKPQQQVAPQSPPQPLQSPRPEASQTSEQTSQQASQQPSQQPSEQPPQQPSQQPPQQPSQQPLPGPNSSSTVQQRPRIPPRDRYNLQSLGPSLNSAVKQVRQCKRLPSSAPTTRSSSSLAPSSEWPPMLPGPPKPATFRQDFPAH